MLIKPRHNSKGWVNVKGLHTVLLPWESRSGAWATAGNKPNQVDEGETCVQGTFPLMEKEREAN